MSHFKYYSVAGAFLCSSFVHLQAAELNASDFKPNSLSNSWFPVLGASLGYDTNLLHSHDDKQSSAISNFSLLGQKRLGSSISFLQLRYGLDSSHYSESSADNSLDFKLNLKGHHEFTRHHQVNLDFSHSRSHEARGTGLSEGNGAQFDSPLDFDIAGANLKYQVGYSGSRLRSEFKLGQSNKSYLNYRELTKYRDLQTLEVGLELGLQMLPKTYWLVALDRLQTQYEQTNEQVGSLDNTLLRLRTGMNWELSGITTGTVKLGFDKKKFEDINRPRQTSTSWDVGIIWKLRSYSTLFFNSSQGLKEARAEGDYIESKGAEISWKHEWLERLSTQLDLSLLDENHQGANREQDTQIISGAAQYQFNNWLQLKASYERLNKGSTAEQYAYDKDLMMLSFVVSI